MADWKKVTVSLTHPIMTEDGEIKSLTLLEPNVEALEEIDELELSTDKNPSIRQLRRIIEILGNLPDGAAKSMSRTDFHGVINSGFLELLQDTAETTEIE